MRLWHYELLPYLPDLQFKGQLREIVAIVRDLKHKGMTNHLLINRVMKYPISELYTYFEIYKLAYETRYKKSIKESISEEFDNLISEKEREKICKSRAWYLCSAYGAHFYKNENGNITSLNKKVFDDWHDKEYLRVCMANLYEKHEYGIGKSRITDEEWQRLLDGYKTITGEEYRI